MANYDFSSSNLLLLVGGQLVFLIIAIMVLLFGVGPIQFEYAEQMKNMVSKASNSASSAASAASNNK